jgi:hypothetical protein
MINTKELKKWDEVRIEWEDIVGAGGTISDKTVFPKGCIRRIWVRSRMVEEWFWEPRHIIIVNDA